MPRSRSSADLHGSAPDKSPVALLIIDMINAFDFEGAEGMLVLTGGARSLALQDVYGSSCL
jgi:hypothetical protein